MTSSPPTAAVEHAEIKNRTTAARLFISRASLYFNPRVRVPLHSWILSRCHRIAVIQFAHHVSPDSLNCRSHVTAENEEPGHEEEHKQERVFYEILSTLVEPEDG